ncbi:DegQ family serine endoprotease [Janthinobacterium agaricidamnosum]|uniref:Probable periplasmic serine endoprotease DegP-like n=1 Tax=Janthinobacterium agaricidamnosum NBRC 102515 = DSM 9628 TaxID=1349767 RepID=W0V311_9BURK|nr:DegQ family serine endoprotease [Janthinobacterium agaricidamnosum]CDG82266.1 protease Do family protein [Janthinobacterium agaricidamnosum NBRC 102515 = DSM 9628]
MKKNISAGSKTLSALLISAGVLFAPAMAGLAPAAQAAAVAGLPDFTDLVDKVGPAVVNIRTTERLKLSQPGQGGSDEAEMQEFLRRFFGGALPPQLSPGQPSPRQQAPRRGRPAPVPQEQEVQRGVGSGFIISADGYVLTNAHVVDGADEVYVTLTDKREFKAKVLGADARTDVALLKIEGASLPRLTMGDSSKIRVGEWVIAIGSPFNLENSVTAGIISAKSRDTGDYLPLIQSDVAVNPGNSGGPLINMRGEVIGINSQIATLSGGYNGISFAVPIDEAMRVGDQLKKAGKVTRGRIGVQIGELSKEVAESLGLKDAKGAQVSMVEPGGPADKGGIKAGDIILKFNGVQIERSSDLPRLVGGTAVNSKATVTVWRKGALQEVPVTVVELENDKKAGKKAGTKAPADEQPSNALGLTVSDLSDVKRKELKVDAGVLVEDADGVAAAAGLQAGDVILQVNNTGIKDAKQFNAVVARLDPKKASVVLVRRGDTSQYVSLRPSAK